MKHLLFVLLAFLPASMARADQIIAETSGLANPDFVEDFGAGLYPNFTPITTEFPPLVFSHTRYYTTGSSNNLQGGFLTNDFSGAPDTFTVRFPGPVTEVSFVYHQIGTFAASNFRVLLGGVVVDSFSNQSNQTQPNNYFGFTNLLFDELQVDFVADFNIDELAYSVAGGRAPTVAPEARTPSPREEPSSPARVAMERPALPSPWLRSPTSRACSSPVRTRSRCPSAAASAVWGEPSCVAASSYPAGTSSPVPSST